MSTQQPLLEIKNVYKVFGEQPQQAMQLLEQGLNKEQIFHQTGQTIGVMDASFEVNRGEIFVVMGLSGSGKSTMVRLLNRLIEPTSGTIKLDGKDITALNDNELLQIRRREMSMVFQSFALMPHLSVLRNAAFGLEISGVDPKECEARAMDALEQVGLGAHAQSFPHQLSGGMQQRVGLARALANDPTILLMDEAFSALDPLIRMEMQDELIRLQQEQQRTIVFISHDLDEAIRIGDRIAIMEGGRVVQVGTPQEILQNPADEYVRTFFKNVDAGKVLHAQEVAQTGTEAEGYRYDLNDQGQLQQVIDIEHDQSVGDVQSIQHDTLLKDILHCVANEKYPVPVLDQNGCYQGYISKQNLLQTLHAA